MVPIEADQLVPVGEAGGEPVDRSFHGGARDAILSELPIGLGRSHQGITDASLAERSDTCLGVGDRWLLVPIDLWRKQRDVVDGQLVDIGGVLMSVQAAEG